MKKVFTLAFALVAMFVAAQAQITDDFESYTAFTVDPTGTWTYYDGDGLGTYGINGVTFTNAYYTGSCIVFNPTQTSPDCSANYPAHSGSQYLIFFNGVPDDSTGVSATNDWIISPALSFSGTAILSFYARELTTNYGSEVMKIWYSTTTNTPSAFTLLQTENVNTTTWTPYTYTIPQNATYVAISCNSTDVFGLMIDDISIMETPTSPTIVCSSNNLDFGTVLLGQSSELNTQVTAYNLTTGITASTSAPFSVSADGTTYGTTASVAQTGGTLYVKYAPTTAGTASDMVVLTSTGANNDTIVVTGNGLDCNNITVPFTEGFESTIDCWTMVSMNTANESYFGIYADANAYAGTHDFRFSSLSSATDYNQYLITPELTLSANETYTVSFYYKGRNANENFKVMYSTTNNDLSSFTVLADYNSNVATSWTQAAHVLPAGTKYVAINYYGNYQYYLYVDEFSIQSMSSGPDVTVSGPTRLMAGATGTFIASSPLATAFAWEVDGAAATSTTDTLTYIFTTAGIHNVKVTASNSFGSAADSMDVDIFTCDAITTFPFTESFDETSTTMECWQIVDANEDGSTFEFDDDAAIYSYNYSNNANDYLISPELTLTSGLYGHIDYAAYSSSYPEKFSIYVIPENGTIANAVNIVPTVTVTNSDAFATQPFDLSAYANQTIRVAIKAESDANMWDLIFDNFVVEALPTTETLTVDPTSMNFITVVGNTSDAQTADVAGTMLANDINVTTTAPFEVSVDGTTFGATATIPGGNIVTATLYVRYAPTTPGTQTGTVTLTSSTTTATISLTGEGVDCSGGIASLPFTHDFNDAVIPPFCWGYESASSFLRLNVDTAAGDYGIAIGQPDYLMTPEIHSTSNMNISFDYSTYGGSQASSSFRVGYSSDNNINNFTWLETVTVAETISGFNRYSANIPSGSKYIAIQATDIGSFVYYIWQYPNYLLLDNITIAEGDGIDDIDNNVSIYPNPANNMVTVNAASNINTVEVFNMMGQRVAAYDANDTNIQINTTALNNGMYMMRITTENGVSNQKLMIAR